MNDSGTIPWLIEEISVDPQRYLDLDTWHRTAAWLLRNDPVHLVEAKGFKPFYRGTPARPDEGVFSGIRGCPLPKYDASASRKWLAFRAHPVGSTLTEHNTGQIGVARTMFGITEESTTRNPSTPRTRQH
jgi:hypothetical protein